MRQNRLKHFVQYSRIYSKKLSDGKIFCGFCLWKMQVQLLAQKRRSEPRGFKKVIVHTSQQTTQL